MDTAHSAQVISLLTESTTDQAFVLHFVTLVLVCKLLAVGELVVAEVALGGGETLAHAAAARAGLGLALAVCLGELRAVGALVQTRRLSSAVKRSIGFTIVFHNHGKGPIPYDFCVCDPISHLLTVGSTPV